MYGNALSKIKSKPGTTVRWVILLLAAWWGKLPEGWGQTPPDFRIYGKSITQLRQTPSYLPLVLRYSDRLPSVPRFSAQSVPVFFQVSAPKRVSGAGVPIDFAFFCRLENKLEKSVRFPVKIRLGEVQYVENMEGKY